MIDRAAISRIVGIALAIHSTVALAACGGGSSNDDGKIAAIQTALDAKPPNVDVPNGKNCTSAAVKYVHLSAVKATANGTNTAFGYTNKCYVFTWNANAGLIPSPNGYGGYAAPIGRYVVDKIGAEHDVTTGFGTVKATPDKAHFEARALGKEIIAAGIATPAPDITDGQAALHQDADGKWIVSQ